MRMSWPSGRIGLPRIADAPDIVLVVQRRIRNDDAADRHRLQPRHRRQRAGAPDLDVDAGDHSHRLFGGKLVRRRPAGAARAEAEPFLQVQPVDLVDDAVDVVGQLGAIGLDGVILRQQFLDAAAAHHALVDREPPIGEALHHIVLRVGWQFAHFTPGIGEEAQRPGAGHLRVELAQAAGRRIARIGEDAAGFLHALIEREEILATHVDLAANLHDLRHALRKLVGDFVDGADVGGDVLARRAVAARGGRHQPAVLVAQRHRQPVDLRLRREHQFLVGGPGEKALHAGHEVANVLVGKHVVERQHGSGVPDRSEGAGRSRADPL